MRQIFDDLHQSNISGVYTPQITDAWACVKYLTDIHLSNIWGCRPPKYLTDIHGSNISGVYTPHITDT